MAEQYLFAKEGDDLAQALQEKVWKFQDHMINTGIAASWKTNKDFYEGKFFTEFVNMDILDAGEQGEMLATGFNHFRNIVRHILNPIESYTPEFTVTAANGDIESIRSTEIGKQVVDYYNIIKRYQKIDNDVMEYAAVYGQGYHVEEWNQEFGREIIKNGKFTKEGDFDPEALSVWDVFFDFLRKSKKDWYIFRRRKNKYDIAAAFENEDPEKAEAIRAMKPYYLTDKYFKDVNFTYNYMDSDDIYLYSAYHIATPSLPDGRYVLFVGDSSRTSLHLYDSVNVYKEEMPIFEVKPGRYLETGIGYTDVNSLRAPQMVLNNAISMMITNMQSAVKSIWTPTGEEVSVEELSSGRNNIQSKVKPEVIDLYTGDPALMNFVQFCIQNMETLSAQNAVVRGNVASAPQLKSGIALQTVIAMGQQYSQSFSSAKKELFEDVNTFRLKVLARVADSQRLIDICGKANTATIKEFTGQDIKDISRVIIQEVNPIAKTYAGRIEMAFELLKLNKININQYYTMVHTGNLDVATSAEQAMVDYIAQVKDKLYSGLPVQAISGADHASAIKEVHAMLLNLDFSMKPENAQKVQAVLKFITDSMDLMRNGDQISNLIYGGQAPQPAVAADPAAMGQPQAAGAQPVPMQPGQIGQNIAKNLNVIQGGQH